MEKLDDEVWIPCCHVGSPVDNLGGNNAKRLLAKVGFPYVTSWYKMN